jgi:hypothetical protein
MCSAANHHPILALERTASGAGPPPAGSIARGAELEATRAQPVSAPAESMLFSASYTAFMASKVVWTKKTQTQAEAVLARFLSLMGDRTVIETTRSVGETFKERLQRVPAFYRDPIDA